MAENKKSKWVLIRNGEIRFVFKDRREAVKYFKELLNQTLKDFDKQDKNDNCNYPIKVIEFEIKPVEERQAHLSLL